MTKYEFTETLFAIQEVQNLVFNFMNTHIIHKERISDCGVLSIGYNPISFGKPIINLFQLWSFYEIDKKHKWIKGVEIHATHSNITSKITGRLSFKGKWYPEIYKWFDLITELDRISVHIIPIEPYCDREKQKLIIGEKEFQISNISSNIVEAPLRIKGRY